MEKCGLEAASAVFPIMAVPERKGSRNCLTFRMDMTNSPHARHGASGHTDPVCGAQVGEDTPWKAGYQGKTYFSAAVPAGINSRQRRKKLLPTLRTPDTAWT